MCDLGGVRWREAWGEEGGRGVGAGHDHEFGAKCTVLVDGVQ